MSKAKKGKLRSIHIETGANGYSVRAHHAPPMSKGDGPSMPMMDSDEQKPNFFNSKEEVRDHVHGLMAAHEGAASDNDADDAQAEHPLRKAVRRKW